MHAHSSVREKAFGRTRSRARARSTLTPTRTRVGGVSARSVRTTAGASRRIGAVRVQTSGPMFDAPTITRGRWRWRDGRTRAPIGRTRGSGWSRWRDARGHGGRVDGPGAMAGRPFPASTGPAIGWAANERETRGRTTCSDHSYHRGSAGPVGRRPSFNARAPLSPRPQLPLRADGLHPRDGRRSAPRRPTVWPYGRLFNAAVSTERFGRTRSNGAER